MGDRIVKGIWVPIEIWDAEDLSWNEKILLMEIDSFTKRGSECYFSNEYISKLLKINETNANRTLSSLIEKGYVKKVRFDGRHRYVESALVYSDELPIYRSEDSRNAAKQGCRKQQGCLAENGNILNTCNNKDYIEKENIVKENSAKRFVKPSVEEVMEYISQKGYSVDAVLFHSYYESNGWHVGRSPMKDWHAAVATWQKKETNKKERYGNSNYPVSRKRVNYDFSKDRSDI